MSGILRSILRALATILLMSAPLSATAFQTQTEILVWSGEIVATKVSGFLVFLSQNEDRVVGIDIWIDETQLGEIKHEIDDDDEANDFPRLNLIYNSEFELRLPSEIRLFRGSYSVEGFFVPRTFGPHQGIFSISLEPVDWATVTLSGVKISPATEN